MVFQFTRKSIFLGGAFHFVFLIIFQITSKGGEVILLSKEDWNAMQETIYLSSIKGFQQSLVDADNDEWIPENEVDW